MYFSNQKDFLYDNLSPKLGQTRKKDERKKYSKLELKWNRSSESRISMDFGKSRQETGLTSL